MKSMTSAATREWIKVRPYGPQGCSAGQLAHELTKMEQGNEG